MEKIEQISYAKTVYGQEEIDAVNKCLQEPTQMGNYSRLFEKKSRLCLIRAIAYMLTQVLRLYT